MKSRTQKWIGGIALVALVGFIGLNLLAYRHARAMLHYVDAGERTSKPEALSARGKVRVLFTGVTVPRPGSDSPPSVLDPQAKALSIPVPGDITLSAWHCDRGPEKPLVILFHGYAAGKTDQIAEAKAFLELDCSVLLVDFRGSGGSSESDTSLGFYEADDVQAASAFAKANLPHARMILFGQSMGAVAMLRAIHVHRIAPDAIIVESVFDRMINTVRNRFRLMGVPSFPAADLLVFWGGRQQGFNAFRHNPVDYAESVRCPSLFLHGEHDPRARLADAKHVYEKIGGRRQFQMFTGVSHESFVQKAPANWEGVVTEFLNSALLPNKD